MSVSIERNILDDPCKEITKEIEEIDGEIKRLTDKKKELIKECNILKYISKEEQPQTLMELIKYIFVNKITSYDGLVNKFPDSKEREGGKYTKNYIFEALWKIIFLLKFDNLVDVNKYKRIYKASIENERLGKDGNVLTEYKYLSDAGGIEKINSGSKSGICDFYFTIEKIEENPLKTQTNDENKIQWACEESKFKPEPNDAYMFTSKLYNKPKGIQDFDYQNIAIEALEIYKDKTKYKIVALVKNAEELRKVIMGGSDKALKAYADSNLIFDETDLRNTYYPILYKWLTNNFLEENNDINNDTVWETLLGSVVEPVFNIKDNLRFHQRYVVEYTHKVIETKLAEQETSGGDYNPGRFIWGAVARSGKSYMVGGLVAKRKPRIVILLLGAINETKGQFTGELFEKYTDLKKYKVIDLQKSENDMDKYKSREVDPSGQFVIVISQESLRAKVFKDMCLENMLSPSIACENFFIENCNKRTIEDKYCEEHKKKIDKTTHPDTYNDKYAKKNETMKKNIQKTFKPTKTLKQKKTANTFIMDNDDLNEDGRQITPYNDSQITFLKELLKEREKIIFFDEIHQGGGSDSLQEQTIQFFYDEKYPKPLLIMVTATYAKPLGKYGKNIDGKDSVLILWSYEMIMLMKKFTIDYVSYDKERYKTDENAIFLIDKNDAQFEEKMELLYNLTLSLNDSGVSCEAIAKTYEKNPELVYLLPTLKDTDIVEMEVDTGEKINIKNHLKYFFEIDKKTNKFKYDNEVNNILTYINKNVYDNLLNKKYDFIANGGGNKHTQLWFLPTSMKNTNGDNIGDDKSIIGPMSYELARLIINHSDFINFNVCVIHGKTTFDKNYDKLESDTDLKNDVNPRKAFFNCIKYKDVKNCIKRIENESKKEGKSLIILTGQRLRLGISLPCADVAIHMDDINSYDIIFQSMFRVLTERSGKKQGFFVDMVLDRAIKFFYKYTNIQQKFTKQTNDPNEIEVERERVRKNLLRFDVGSISKSLGFSSISEPVNSYKHIAEAFKIDSNEKFVSVKKDIFEDKKDEDYENPEIVKNPSVVKQDFNSSEIIKKSKEDIVKLLESLYNNVTFQTQLKDLIKNTDKKFAVEMEKRDKAEIDKPKPFKTAVDLQNEAEQEANADSTAVEYDQKNDDDKILKEHFKNVAEQIQNTFSLYILFNNNVTLTEIIKDNDTLTHSQISNIKKCTDDDILYYCYLVVTQQNEHKIGDKVIKIVFNQEDVYHKNDQKITQLKTKRKPNRTKQEMQDEKKLKLQQKNEREQQKNERLTQKLGILNGGDGDEEGTIINIYDEKTNKDENGKEKKIKYYTIKWDDPEKGEEIYEKSKFDKELENISFTQNYDLSKIDDNTIKNIIKQHINLLQFLIKNQEKNNPINKLFDNIKEEMGKLKKKINVEKNAFNDDITQFCPTMYNEGNEKVLDIIRKYLTPKKEEKNLFGEVFTPLTLVCDMLSHLPVNVWKNPNLTWLDPANGIGNFPLVVYFKLMETLKTVTGYGDEKKRSKHIIEKMLYMNELNPVNIGIAKKIFTMIDSDAMPNILKGDFLSGATLKDRKFDIIIGNPPYNTKKTESGSSGNNLWPQFAIKSFYMLNERGILCLIHPPGWKKPTDEIFNPKNIDIDSGEYYKYDKKTGKQTIKQIRQGQIWQVLKDKGSFTFIYTNDQQSKSSSIPNFPAVDYYVYQKDVIPTDKGCDTKNIFFGDTTQTTGVRLNYNLTYLSNLITTQTQDILHKVTSKDGDKPKFKAGFDPRGFKSKEKGSVKYIYDASVKGPNYSFYNEKIQNVDISKVVINYGGGINGFYCSYISENEKTGVLHMTMYTKVESDKEGKRIEYFFNSDLVKFIFLITQYASGKMTKNEPLVANSITIPPEGITDYYAFFGIEKHQKYIEDILAQYNLLKAPKRKNKENTELAEEPKQPKPEKIKKTSGTKKTRQKPIKSIVKKTQGKVKLNSGGNASKKNKTKKQSKMKMPQKTIRRRK